MWNMWWQRSGPAGSPNARETGPERVDGPARPRLSPGSDLVARAGTWDFSPEVARQVVRGQSWKDLTGGWRLSRIALFSARSAEGRLGLVTLRAAILDEMEAQDPLAFDGWLARQGPTRRWRRG